MYTIIDFSVKGDERGNLVALERLNGCPFEIKRVYYIWGTVQDVTRGKHAHKNLEQVIICTSGSCDFILDDGVHRETVHLNTPSKGLYIKNKVWREFNNFSRDCVIMVLASECYHPNDYINNYQDFLMEVGKHR